MAIVTCRAVVLVSVHALVILVDLLLIIVLMAVNATETVVVAADMAFHALVPFVVVLAAVNREVHIVMVEIGRLPSIL